MGQVCLMGRSTFESIGRVLPGRIFVVLSRSKAVSQPDVHIHNSVQAALQSLAHQKEIFVIGGGKVYAELMPMASKLYLTRIYSDVAGDTYFQFPESEWVVQNCSGRLRSKSGLDYEFIDYERKAS